MTRIIPFLILFTVVYPALGKQSKGQQERLNLVQNIGIDHIDKYVALFNADDEELYKQAFANTQADSFMKNNIPLLDCPDKELEKTYYFRWWTYRKHIKQTPEGYVITEYLPKVSWSGKYNTISCPASFHFLEGRWLRDSSYLNDYARFWMLDKEARPRKYSFPVADAILELYKVKQDKQLLQDVYEPLKDNFTQWHNSHFENNMYWQSDNYDGMEISISGAMSKDATGYRPTINSYMYADARAISSIASILGHKQDGFQYAEKAQEIKNTLNSCLWDEKDTFYKVIPRYGDMSLSPVRELHGFVPWMYNIPEKQMNSAWLQLTDTMGFKAPYGPTTAERRAKGFKIDYTGHNCQWNGPSWPFATAQTLTGLARCIHRFGETEATKDMFFETLQTFSNCHRMKKEGQDICWIDENLNPFTGEWLARQKILSEHYKYRERGKDYNHSSFCNIIIEGLMGVQPQMDGNIIVEPLLPKQIWDYFFITGLVCNEKSLTLVYDKTGKRYGMHKGFCIFVDGKKVFHSKDYSIKAHINLSH